MSTFFDMGLSNYIIKATADMGFEEATPIQEKTIPVAMAGRDIIGQAQTGTGKTAAFAIPMIENMERYPEGIGGLVVTPTRELAVQVAEEINKIGQFKGIHAQPIYGGQDINRQIRALRNRPQIIVGTPGRLMDHMRRSTIRLNNVSMVVLDEADEMLSMGFIEDIENILGEIEQQHQTMLFSATMPQSILNLSKRFMSEPEFISIKAKEVTVPNTEQYYIELPERQKFDVLCRLLDIQSPDLAIVFGRTKRRVDELYEGLNKRGYSAEGIHGDLTQLRRDSVLRHFKEGVTDILVATDVAARGLDISGVTHIYNFDIPQDPESYVHRIGRTGRAGKTGLAVTFVTPREQNHLRLIEQVTKRRIIRKPMPTINEALEGQQRITMEQLIKAVDDPESHRYIELAEELLDSNDSTTLLAAALKLLTKEPNTTPVILTEESPVFSRSPRYEKPRQSSYYQRNRRNRSDIRTDGRNDYRPENRPENRSYNRPENRSGNRPDYRTNNRTDYRSNSHNDYRTDIRPDYRTNNRTEQRSDSKTDNSSE